MDYGCVGCTAAYTLHLRGENTVSMLTGRAIIALSGLVIHITHAKALISLSTHVTILDLRSARKLSPVRRPIER